MFHLIEKHPEEVLITLAAIMLLILGVCYAWGIQVAAESINRTIAIPNTQVSDTKFNIQAAEKLNFKGLPPAEIPE